MKHGKVDISFYGLRECFCSPRKEREERAFRQFLNREKGGRYNSPFTSLVDINADDVIFFLVKAIEDCGGGTEGDLMFMGTPAKKEANFYFFWL